MSFDKAPSPASLSCLEKYRHSVKNVSKYIINTKKEKLYISIFNVSCTPCSSQSGVDVEQQISSAVQPRPHLPVGLQRRPLT